jgi:ectoine hydroxylase-related dioxygenase (phytanoyl-CoA dioxygenase family)
MAFTAVLYIDASPEQGTLVIENPLDMILMTQPISPEVKYPMRQEIEVHTGDLVIFPGYLKHSVNPNLTDKERIVLAFNIGCRGKYWASQWITDHD